MAENINKVFHGGQWYNDDDSKRYDHVMKVLDLCDFSETWKDPSKWFDMADVKWFIKNAIVNNIYVSEDVFNDWANNWKNVQGRQKDIWDEIQQNGYASGKCMDIRKYTKGYRFEHVVPAKVFLDRLVELYKKGELTLARFKQLRDKVNICIITQDENTILDTAGLRQKMPNGVTDFEKDEFARYGEAGIQIHV